MEEIKSCPFCGGKAKIVKSISLYKGNNSYIPKHDIEIQWTIRCEDCGTEKKSTGSTYYNIADDEKLEIVNADPADERKTYDKLYEVVTKWNERHCEHDVPAEPDESEDTDVPAEPEEPSESDPEDNAQEV